MLELITMVQSVRHTRLPMPQFTFMVKFRGQKVKFSQRPKKYTSYSRIVLK